MIVWDRGTWTPVGDPHAGLAKGHLEFELHGEKLNGRWHLVRMRSKAARQARNWLLIKSDDEYARDEDEPDILEERPESAATGRPIDEVAQSRRAGRARRPIGARATAGGASARAPTPARRPSTPNRSRARRARRCPPFVEPMLATLVEDAAGRASAGCTRSSSTDTASRRASTDGHVRLLTRGGLDWTEKFGDGVVEALASPAVREALIDGELVVENASGVSDFSAASGGAERRPDRPLRLLRLRSSLSRRLRSARGRRSIRRKEALRGARRRRRRARRASASHFEESGDIVLQHACRLGLEGVVSKDRDSPYRSGRGRALDQVQMLGATGVRHRRLHAVDRVAQGDRLARARRLRGRARCAMSAGSARASAPRSRRALFARLEPMRVATSPFAGKLAADEARGLALRPAGVGRRGRFPRLDGGRPLAPRLLPGPARGQAGAARSCGRTPRSRAIAKPQRRSVTLTHPDRVYWPDDGVTKEGLADYYAEVWPRMAPFVVGRPLALVRCPDGIDGPAILPEARLEGPERAHRARRMTPRSPGAADRNPRLRRTDRRSCSRPRWKSIPGARRSPTGSGPTRSSWTSTRARTSPGRP